MNKLSTDIIAFAGTNNVSAYEKFADYYKHYSNEVLKKNIGAYDTAVSFAEKEVKMNEALLAEIERVCGQKMPEGMNEQMWAANPNFKWAAFAVVTMMIETILPATVINSIGLYTDMRFIGWGDVALFDTPTKALPLVSKGANAQRTTLIQKFYRGNATVEVANHVITTSVDLYRVLAGRDSLAEFARRCVIAIETNMTQEAYTTITNGLLGASTPASLKVSGAFDMEKLITLCQRVGAYNFGMKPIIAGTAVGLMKVLPDSAAGYRINADANGPRIDLIRTAYGYDFMVLDQVAIPDYTNYGMVLNDNLLMVISPAADKLVRGVIEGSTLTNSNDYYENADLTSNFTINKRYGFGYLSGAIAGSYQITA